jgi:hypothetical protein
MVLCGPNASSTGNMKTCGGLAGWLCPEGTQCELPSGTERAMDPKGTCVPALR